MSAAMPCSLAVAVLMSVCLAFAHSLPQPAPPPAPGHNDYLNGYNMLCRVMCARQYGCPTECSLTGFDLFKKRAAGLVAKRKFGDFSRMDRSGVDSFDDYLFMRLLGRNLGE